MIIVHLSGGLGNQMFQYAAGKALALRRKTGVCLDVSSFEGYALHNGFELKRIFDCPATLVSDREIRQVFGWRAIPRVRWLLSRSGLAFLLGKHFAIEPDFSYWRGYEQAPADCYLYGYWQSEKYFLDVAASIRDDFQFKGPLSEANAKVAEQIAAADAVSLHVRRGDYLKNPVTLAKHGVCSLEYYRAAIARIAEQVEHPVFFVFSDDIAWVREHLAIEHPCVYVGHNSGVESFNDMRLMSMCRHHIIANSSFSWWGAWLAQSPGQIVIAPEPWFNDRSIDTKDLLPGHWLRLPKEGGALAHHPEQRGDNVGALHESGV